MIIMPSLAALAGRAGWNGTGLSVELLKLRKRILLGLCKPPNKEDNLTAEWKRYSSQGENIWMAVELDIAAR